LGWNTYCPTGKIGLDTNLLVNIGCVIDLRWFTNVFVFGIWIKFMTYATFWHFLYLILLKKTMINKEEYYSAIDIGSSKVVTIIGKQDQYGKIKIIALGQVTSTGVIRGIVVNKINTTKDILKSVEIAEQQAGFKIKEVVCGINGQHVSKTYYNNSIKLDRFKDVFVQQAALDNLESCIVNVGLQVKGFIPNIIASTLAVLTEQEKKRGVVLIDIGAETCNFVSYVKVNIIHISVYASKDSADLFEFLKIELLANYKSQKYVLTGGNSQSKILLNHMKVDIKKEFRIGFPVNLSKPVIEQINNPCYASVLGMLEWGINNK
jgi:cell division ATPase FtsA